MNKNELILIVNELLIREYGIPERAKILPNPLDLLIATILSQNTNDNNSYKAYLNLKSNIESYSDIIDMDLEYLEKLIKVAGLAKQKAKSIKNFLITLRNKYNKNDLEFIKGLSNDKILELLTKNEGIGVKTASCVLLFSLNRDVCPVDTHVHRLINRLGIVSAKTPDKSFYMLNVNFPSNIAHSFHTNLIKHGRNICKPKLPYCGSCILYDLCIYGEKLNRKVETKHLNRLLLLDKV
jgi:endonuclease-3